MEAAYSNRHAISDSRFVERFENLLPSIIEIWPDIARQTLESTKGSLDDVVRVIESRTGLNSQSVRQRLYELMEIAEGHGQEFADHLDPLEKQLEQLLDELNKSLRPKIEEPLQKKPFFTLGLVFIVGVLIGSIINRGRRT